MSQITLKKIMNAYGMVLILIALFLLLSVSIEGFFSARTSIHVRNHCHWRDFCDYHYRD